MVSTQSSYLKGVSPPRYRRQTLEIFDIYNSHSHKTDFTHLPARPVSALDRKWVHRSVGDLTLDREVKDSHPCLQTDFYQELFQKYPQAFMQRRNAKEVGRKLFNSRLHVRFEDEEKHLDKRSRSDMNLHKNNHQLTNWDREVGPYMRKNSRECFTSADQSECSGSVLSLKQRLHINSVTLNKLLHEKSPLRKKFERDRAADDSGTENEQTLEEYFLDKSRQRSHNRVKHRRILQRRLTSNMPENSTEQERTTAYRRWISKSVSPSRRNMYSLPVQHDKSNSGHSHDNIDSVMKNTDLKIDTLLEKISSKLSGPESPPDSAIDIDTPSVQSFVTSDKVMNSDNVYQVSIDLSADDKDGDLDSHSSPESSPNMYNNKLERTISESAIVRKSANSTEAVILPDSLTAVYNNKHKTEVQHIEKENDIGNEIAPVEGPGLLRLYMKQLNPNTSDKELHTVSDSYRDKSTVSSVMAEASEKNVVNGLESPRSERESNSKAEALTDSFGLIDNQGMIAVIEPEMDITTALPPGGRLKEGEVTSNSVQPIDKNVSSRSDVDTSILDEIQLNEMSHDLNGRHSSLDNVDDTDVRLGIPKVSLYEARIAEKYRRARSPSPFIVKNRKAIPRDRPSSTPLLRKDVMEMKIIDIPLTGSGEHCESVYTLNTHVKHTTGSDIDTCPNHDINNRNFIDIVLNGQSKCDAKKKSCVQITDSKILVSSSQIKERSNPNAVETVGAEIHPSYIENGISTRRIAEAMNNVLTDENSDTILIEDSEIPKELSEKKQSEFFSNKDLDPTDDKNQDHQFISEQKGFYKPSATSPRVNEKRIRVRNLLKSKKGSYSPAPPDVFLQDDRMAEVSVVRKSEQNFVAVKHDRLQHHDHKESELTIDGSSRETLSLMSLDDTDNTVQQNSEICLTEVKEDPNVTLKESTTGIQEGENALIHKLQDSDTESGVETAKSKSNMKHGHTQVTVPSTGTNCISASHESLPQSANVPPVKPARTKHKKLPPNPDLFQDKIMPNGHETVMYSDSSQRRITRDAEHSMSNPMHQDTISSKADMLKDPDDRIEVVPDPYRSNLERSKDISTSKTSLFGGFKSATKGKFKSLKKAMSLDKGIDKAGAASFPDPNKQTNTGRDNVEVQKMKKAPSLKSIASLFGRKKKKGKLTFADVQSSSTPGSCLSLSSDLTGSAGNQQPASSVIKPVAGSRPVGKLQAVNPDGTQLIHLSKPKNGPIGFFIAKGSSRYKNGIFISRFADSQPEKVFGGLLSVGDEILEINGQFVRDLSQDDVYNIISASPIIVMKILPFIARKDV